MISQMIDKKAWNEAFTLIESLEKHTNKVEHEFIARIKAQKLYIYLLLDSLHQSQHQFL